jgi:hypothetical protein
MFLHFYPQQNRKALLIIIPSVVLKKFSPVQLPGLGKITVVIEMIPFGSLAVIVPYFRPMALRRWLSPTLPFRFAFNLA